MTLTKKFGNTLIWSFLDNIVLKGLAFLVILILTRLLSPEDFGLVGILQIVIVIGNSIVEGGFGQSIIRDERSNSVDFSTVFYLTLVVGLVLYVFVYFSAPLISTYFENDLITELLRLYALIFILAPFSLIQRTILMKNINFRKIFILNAPGALLGGGIAIYMAYHGYGVWSVIWLHISTYFFKGIFLWFGSSWKPEFVFSIERLKYHFDFGSKLVASSIMGSMFRELNTVVIAKSFSVVSLGFYTRAKTYNVFPASIFTDIISKTSYPILSEIKNDRHKFSQSYQSIIRTAFFTLTPLMFTLAVVSLPLFELLFTAKWLPAAPYFRILTLSTILYPIHELNITVFKIFGKTGLFLRLNLLRQILVVIAVVIGIYTSLEGLLWAMVAISYVALFINTHYSGALISYSTVSQIKDILKIMIVCAIASGLAYVALDMFLTQSPLIIQVLIPAIISITIYILISAIVKTRAYLDCLSFATTIYKSLKRKKVNSESIP